MFIQLFVHSTKDMTVTHNNYTNTAWPGAKGKRPGASPIASPRSKATKVAYTSNESSIILHFIKTNLRLILKLIASEIHKKEDISLNKDELNSLRILMKIEEGGEESRDPISSFCPLFSGSPKSSLSDLHQWINENL